MLHLAEAPVSRAANNFPELSDQLEKDLVQVFKLLSDETRLRILMYLMREGELHVTALCERLGQSQPAVSHHLALLRVAGQIEARRDGKHNFYSIKSKHFHRLIGELFSSISDPDRDEIRFQDFVLTHEG
jgi:ArsR family transcriptional regulator